MNPQRHPNIRMIYVNLLNLWVFIMKLIIAKNKYGIMLHVKKCVDTTDKDKDKDETLISITTDEHNYARELYRLIGKEFTDHDGYYTDSTLRNANALIDLLFKHITHENNIVYPMVIQRLSQSEMEELSKKLDEIDKENELVIKAMETLHEELTKY
eukprot:UN01262